MHVHNQDRLAVIPRLGEGIKVSKVEAGVPMGKAIVRTGVVVRHESSPPLFLTFVFVYCVLLSVNVPSGSGSSYRSPLLFEGGRAGLAWTWNVFARISKGALDL